MGLPITTKSDGICFAFPDVCLTPAPPLSPVPIPYPNIGQLSETDKASDDVNAGGKPVVHVGSEIPTSSGDEAGSNGGVISGVTGKKVKFTKGSSTVFVNGNAVVRMFDPTTQNDGNAVGIVLGGFPTVLVGG